MNEVRFRIGADGSSISRFFGATLPSIAATAGAQLRKKLDLKEAFKSSVLALGISIEKISEKIAEMLTGGSQDAWKAALESAKETARIIEETTLKRMNTLRQIEYIEKEIQRNAAKEDPRPQKGETPVARRVLDTIGDRMFSAGERFFRKIGAKNAADAMGRSAEMYRKRGEEPGLETSSEAHSRSQMPRAIASLTRRSWPIFAKGRSRTRSASPGHAPISPGSRWTMSTSYRPFMMR